MRRPGRHPELLRTAATVEIKSTLIRAFELSVVPGILQTPEYAGHILANVSVPQDAPVDVDDGVRARMKRQALLYEPGCRAASS